MNITIFGAAGQVGRRLLDEATTRGHHVTAVTRSGTSSDDLDSATWIAGDARDRQDVARLSRGRDVVISATSGPRTGGDELAVTAQALRDGVADTGARLIVVGGAGPLVVPASGGRLVVDDPRFVPASIRGVAQACVDQLAALRENSTVDWTYFSPAAEMTAGRRTGRFRTGTDELIVDSDGTSRISLEDVAVAVLDEAERPRHVRAVLTAGYSDPVRHSRAVDTVTLRRVEVTA
jgi:putative NADH-flavin reductase